MDQRELSRIISHYATYLQVEKGFQSGTYHVYLSNVRYFFAFCSRYHEKLFLSENWNFSNIGVRELEFFFREHLQVRHWKINTVISYLTSIRSFFRFLREKAYLRKNPIRNFTMQREVRKLIIADITEAEIQQLFQEPPEPSFEGFRNRLILEFFYGLGITPSKQIRIDQVQLDEATQKVQIKSGQQKRILPIAKPAMVVLKQYQTARQLILDHTGQETSAFLINESGKKLTRNRMSDVIKKELVKIGMVGEHAQILRNLSTKHFADHGADVRSMQIQRDMQSFHALDLFKDESFESILLQFKKMHLREDS